MYRDPLNRFKSEAIEHNACSEYMQRWDKCCSNKQLIDLALSAVGMDYICASIANGWGLNPKYISKQFKHFINGAFVSQQNGYTSKIYCEYNGAIESNTTAICIIDSGADIHLEDNCLCNIYLTGECEITLTGSGQAIVICYGGRDKHIIEDKTEKGVKFIDKLKED